MKQLIETVLKDIILPLFYFLFIFSGFSCAIISGIIEYEVFKELYPDKNSRFLGIVLIPFLIVFTFEVSKMFLVFFKHITSSKNTKIFTFLRIILVGISILSTLIFSFYNLNAPEVSEHKENIKANIKTAYKAQIDMINAAIAQQQKIMDEERPSGLGSRFRNAEKKQDELLLDLKNENQIHSEQLTTLNSEIITTHKTDSRILSAALHVIHVAFGGNPKSSYTRMSYIILITFLSLLISIGIETVIIALFKVLATQHKDALDFNNINNSHIKSKAVLGKLIPGFFIFISLIILKSDFSNLPLTMIIIGFGGFMGTSFSNTVLPPPSQKNNTQQSFLAKYSPVIIGGIIPMVFGAITVILFGQNTNVSSVFGLGMAITSGAFGKIGADTILTA